MFDFVSKAQKVFRVLQPKRHSAHYVSASKPGSELNPEFQQGSTGCSGSRETSDATGEHQNSYEFCYNKTQILLRKNPDLKLNMV